MSYAPDAYGWILIPYSKEIEDVALSLRNRRDQKFGNVFAVQDGDRRHYGDLGEMAMVHWLTSQGIHDHHWLVDEPRRSADIRLYGIDVDVKTSKMGGTLQTGFLVFVSDHTLNSSPSSELFFNCCLYKEGLMMLLGGISKADFKKKATLRSAHEDVLGSGGTIHNRECAMWTLPAYELERPKAWLERIRRNSSTVRGPD